MARANADHTGGITRRTFLGATAIAAAGAALGPPVAGCGSAQGARGARPSRGPGPTRVPILDLRGTPRERGRIHGESLRADIRELVGRWREAVGKDRKTDPDTYLAEFVEKTAFGAATERWAPGTLADSPDVYTFGSALMVLGEAPALRYAAGPPCTREYETITFA